MATADITRNAFDPAKRYAANGWQQGRVTTDDDGNDGQRIALEDERRARLDIIGPAGSPDAGFLVGAPTIVAGPGGPEIEFDIGAGTMYLGGLRVENPALQRFRTQLDWLQQPAAERAAPAGPRNDLVYLEVWQQSVTAVEDSELLEAALGGPDTSTRLRTMWRAHLRPGVASDSCAGGWSSLVGSWAGPGGLGTMQPSGERVPDTMLQVTFNAGGPAGDLCSPPVAGGYLGADNQAIRVQLVDATHFTWGFDNASPLYRVRLIGAGRDTLQFDTEPRDQAHWPRGQQVVEVLPWSAVLSNREKLAEEHGHLSVVATAYDPDTRQLVLATPLPGPPWADGDAWKTRPDVTQPPLGDGVNPPAEYFYLRVWDRGSDVASPPAISFVPGTPVALGVTGLSVTLTGTQFVMDDHWIIAARPETPDRVVPWALEVNRGPHGVRRFFTPLATITWPAGAVGTVGTTADCRVTFPPLTRLRGCCTYTVGNGVTSFGQFTSIQAAVNALPTTGGRICVLPGEYTESVVIANRTDVTIEGCGRATRIFPARRRIAVFEIVQCLRIRIQDMRLSTPEALGIIVWGSTSPPPAVVGPPGAVAMAGMAAAAAPGVAMAAVAPPVRGRNSRELRFERLLIEIRDWSAIAIFGADDVAIRRNMIELSTLTAPLDLTPRGRWPAIWFQGSECLIEWNRLVAVRSESTALALGGIQLAGGCRRVEIRRNLIIGGVGNGITLGSIVWIPGEPAGHFDWDDLVGHGIWQPPGFTITIDDAGCIVITWDPPPGRPDGPLVPVSAGDLYDIRIIENEIAQMGSSGIGVAWFFDLSKVDQFISVHLLDIHRNRIRRCLLNDLAPIPPARIDERAYGGIALADVELLTVRENQVVECGRRHIDPVCGIFVLQVEGATLEQNLVAENGIFVEGRGGAQPGLRGGIVITNALPFIADAPGLALDAAAEPLRQVGIPAARVHDNVVAQPQGPALFLIGAGAMSVADNQLTSRGAAGLGVQPGPVPGGNPSANFLALLQLLGGAVVTIVNLGVSNEYLGQWILFTNLKNAVPGPGPDRRGVGRVLAGGNVELHGNQVLLDLVDTSVVALRCATLVLTLDDANISDNQFDCDLLVDQLLTDVMALAVSVRLADNRLKETVPFALLSGSIMGLMVAATGNQSTHCMMLAGNPAWEVDEGNRVLLAPGATKAQCAPAHAIGNHLSGKFFGP
jgi:hypothetical protein